MGEVKAGIQRKLAEGKKLGEFPEDFDTQGVATTIVCVFCGFVTMGNAGLPKATLTRAIKTALRLLE